MIPFRGFPARMEYTPIPNAFLGSLLPQIDDIAELKATLHVFATIYRKREYPRFATFGELLADAGLMAGLRQEGPTPEETLRRGLEKAVGRGTLVKLLLDGGDRANEAPQDAYFVNSAAERRTVDRIRNGELAPRGLKSVPAPPDLENRPNVFVLYEQNIGMLTPMIADELREAEKAYPAGWIEDAIREAVSLNKRSWRYIARILERWAAEGRSDEGRKRASGKTDPDRFIRQEYGDMVQR